MDSLRQPNDRSEAGSTSPNAPTAVPDSDFPADIDWGELQTFFLDHLRGQLDKLMESYGKGDLPSLTRIGHSLKGSGGGVQLPRFSELGMLLEEAGHRGEIEATLKICRDIRDEYLRLRPNDAPVLRQLFTGIEFGGQLA